MNTGSVVGGAILLIIAIWVLIAMPTTDVTTRYLGGAILGILGLALLISGLKRQ